MDFYGFCARQFPKMLPMRKYVNFRFSSVDFSFIFLSQQSDVHNDNADTSTVWLDQSDWLTRSLAIFCAVSRGSSIPHWAERIDVNSTFRVVMNENERPKERGRERDRLTFHSPFYAVVDGWHLFARWFFLCCATFWVAEKNKSEKINLKPQFFHQHFILFDFVFVSINIFVSLLDDRLTRGRKAKNDWHECASRVVISTLNQIVSSKMNNLRFFR